MKRILALFAFLSCSSVYAQIVSAPVLYATADARTYSSYPSTNYGSETGLVAGQDAFLLGVSRSFLKFDLSFLDSNAVITSAILRLVSNGTDPGGAGDLYLDVCNTDWTESGISHSSNISNNTFFPTITTSIVANGKREFQIKDYVQAIADRRLPNTGWRLRRANETNAVISTFYSREHATESNRPQLEIKYYIRSYVSAATIVHTTTLEKTDGSISPTVVNGSDPVKTFRWYNAAGTQIATTQNLTGVGKGWYGLKYYGTAAGDTTFQAFIVGTECEEVSITFDPGPNYIDDAPVNNLIRGAGTTTAFFHNYHNSGGNLNFGAERWTNTQVWYDYRSLMRFRLWIDPNSQVNSALLTLTGNAHNPLNRSNESELNLVTGRWTETGVAQSNLPTYTSAGKILIPGIPAGNNNLTTDISGFFNKWKVNNLNNHGMVIQLQSYAGSFTRMQFHSSDAAVATNRPKVVINVKVNACNLTTKGTTTITDYDQALKKNVSLSIDPPTWAEAPYRYVVSDQAIPDPRGMLKYLNDSVFDPDLDSISFFKGTVNSKTYDFGELDYGTYYIAAFDNKGRRVFDQSNLDLYPVITYNVSTNATVFDNNLIRPNTAANATCEMNVYANTYNQGTVKLNVTALSGSQYYGFVDANRTLSTSSDIRYGFYFNGANFYTISNYVQSAKSFKASADKYVTMNFVNDSIIFSNDATVIDRAALAAGYSFKLGAVMNAASRTRVRAIRTPIKQFFLMMTSGTERTCAVSTGNFQFQMNGFLLNQFGNFNYQLVASNTDESVTSFTGTGVNNGLVTINNVPPGRYKLTCTQTGVATPTSLEYIIYVGVQASWFPTHPNYLLSPNSYSLKRDNLNASAYSSALSTNILAPGVKGWVWFNPVTNAFKGARNDYLTIADNFVNLQQPTSSQTYLSFRNMFTSFPIVGGLPVTIPGGLQIIWWDAATQSTGSTVVPFNAFISIEMTGSMMHVKANNVPVTSLTQPAGFIRLKGNSNRTDEGFKDVHTTFVCTASQTIDQVGYFELGRDYTAGYATAVDGKLKFTFDEEYAIEANKNLQYVVYNDANTAIASGALNGTVTGGATALTYDFDDNRYTLNVSSFATAGKFYHLEVTTSTGQKRYLRFLRKN